MKQRSESNQCIRESGVTDICRRESGCTLKKKKNNILFLLRMDSNMLILPTSSSSHKIWYRAEYQKQPLWDEAQEFEQTYPLKSELRAPKTKAALSTVNIIQTKYRSRLTASTYTCVLGWPDTFTARIFKKPGRKKLELTSLPEQEKVGEWGHKRERRTVRSLIDCFDTVGWEC